MTTKIRKTRPFFYRLQRFCPLILDGGSPDAKAPRRRPLQPFHY